MAQALTTSPQTEPLISLRPESRLTEESLVLRRPGATFKTEAEH